MESADGFRSIASVKIGTKTHKTRRHPPSVLAIFYQRPMCTLIMFFASRKDKSMALNV